ncbi:hypothetical protein E5288_WYG001998 [Bos mutus]|uniref:Uncharacterized protein n=1 Tax=Bos mutus TaxID=72004 RepID=A0A6B0RQS3_9CETA|nr:hypothetical protein [Bos mutus]
MTQIFTDPQCITIIRMERGSRLGVCGSTADQAGRQEGVKKGQQLYLQPPQSSWTRRFLSPSWHRAVKEGEEDCKSSTFYEIRYLGIKEELSDKQLELAILKRVLNNEAYAVAKMY